VRDHQAVVVQAPPGAGKSTRVPPALLDAALTDKTVAMLEPRRVAARAIASRIADERGVQIGGEVGWQVRWDTRVSGDTDLVVMTEGILTRRLQSDPFLSDIGVLVLDEFHERSIDVDIALGVARELLDLRDDFFLVVMSATIAASDVSEYLGAPAVESDGRLYPVDVSWIDHDAEDLAVEVRDAIRTLRRDSADDDGDILVFLPGLRDIDDCRGLLKRTFDDLEIHRLHGSLPDAEQDAALRPGTRRKVVLSTNIAETSLTIEGVTSVIDSGLVKVARAEPSTGFNRLETCRISLSSATQRAGRAGRLQPGRAIRLWPKASEFRMTEYDEPEIQRIDLTGPLLDVIAWAGSDPANFGWYEPPSPDRIEGAVETLRDLGAITDDWSVTRVGDQLGTVPAHPRIGRFLLDARDRGVGPLASRIAACLAERDWVSSIDEATPPTGSDAVLRGELLDDVSRGRTQAATSLGLRVRVGAARYVARVARDFRRWEGDPTATDPSEAARRALLTAYADRIAFRRSGRRFALSHGGSVVLGYESTVRDADVICALQAFGRTRVDGVDCAIVRQASAVDEEWLETDYAGRFHDDVTVRFDADLQRLVARRVRRFDTLVLEEEPASLDEAQVDDAAVARAVATAASDDLFDAFGLEKDDRQFVERVDFLRRWIPELELPDPRDPDFLSQVIWGKTSFSELRRMNFPSVYRRYLDGKQIAALDREAPPRYGLPSGRKFRIDYSDPETPILAARLQEFFGMKRTPKLARNRVALLLHLLAPNYRPAQITQDLESFWKNTYPDVRKELRARYPKHDWPESVDF
jgi:ATP-dependent helicase HrpB